MLTTMIDAIVLLTLFGTICYAYLLDRRLKKLMAVLREMQPMVGQFSEAVDRSAQSVMALREISAGTTAPETAPRRPRAPVRGEIEGPRKSGAKSDLVRTFFDMARDDNADGGDRS